METIIEKLDLLKKQLLFNEMLEEKRFTIIFRKVNKRIDDPSNIKQ